MRGLGSRNTSFLCIEKFAKSKHSLIRSPKILRRLGIIQTSLKKPSMSSKKQYAVLQLSAFAQFLRNYRIYRMRNAGTRIRT